VACGQATINKAKKTQPSSAKARPLFLGINVPYSLHVILIHEPTLQRKYQIYFVFCMLSGPPSKKHRKSKNRQKTSPLEKAPKIKKSPLEKSSKIKNPSKNAPP
jgi:hypothetical protein